MSKSTAIPVHHHLPVYRVALIHFLFFASLCLLTLFAAFYLPLGILIFYPCASFLLSAILLICAIIQMFLPSYAAYRKGLAAAALMALAVPLGVLFLPSLIANGAARIQAARTAPLADFQTWAVKLLNVPSTNPADDYFNADDPKVPANLRPFVQHYTIIVRRQAELWGEEPYVDLEAGGGLSEVHCVLSIGQPSYAPRESSRAWKWADGIYFSFP